MRHKSGTILQLALVFLLTGVLVFVGLNALDATATPSIDKPDKPGKPDKVPPGEPDWQVAIPHVGGWLVSHVYGESENVDGTYAIYDYYDDGKVDVRFVENPPGHINAKRNVLQLWISDEAPDYRICIKDETDGPPCGIGSALQFSDPFCDDPWYCDSLDWECVFPPNEGGDFPSCMADFLMQPQPYFSYHFFMGFRTDIEIEKVGSGPGEFAFYVIYDGGYVDGVEELHSILCTVPAEITRDDDNVWTTTTNGGSLECWEYYNRKGKDRGMRVAEMATSVEPFVFEAIWTKLN